MIRLSVCFFAMIMFVSNISAQNISGLSIPKTLHRHGPKNYSKLSPMFLSLIRIIRNIIKRIAIRKPIGQSIIVAGEG
ncbi:MAG TPA: hypothetical protein PKN57_01225 [Saprospiraceae bacterium]|nr:hypothetical protein [Saprospiraceae bacterium]MCC6687516.1 hypothetical protein [Saprospiraceae bacterium]HMZ72270.1 hypothetical protein [Saprospiraceae bacterium]HNL28360.1 hypothetical protein [Saprospiraceae bacterium]HNM57411.1 hypothetical protein [Saprospiraceae bacterium]